MTSGFGAAAMLAFLAQAVAAAPQWTAVDATGTVMDLRAPIANVAVDPGAADRVYATTGNRVLLSLDGGVTFATLPAAASWEPIAALAVIRPPAAVRPATLPRLLVGAGNHFGGLLVSDDGGRSYAPAHFDAYGGPLPLAVKRIYAAPSDAHVAYVIAFDGLHRSRDGGRTWQPIAMPSGSAYALAMTPSGDGSTVLLGTSNGLYRSIDGGDTWTLVVAGGADGAPALPAVATFDLTSPATAYATSGEPTDRSLLRSRDGGATWTRLGPLPVNCCGTEFAARGGALLATFNGTLYRSTDEGAQWVPSLPGYPAPAALAPDRRSGRVYLGTGDGVGPGGVLASDDFGISWRSAVAGLAAATVTDVIPEARGGALFAIAGGRLHRKRDADDAWRDVTPAATSLSPSFGGRPSFLAPGESRLLVTGNAFLRSDDGGDTWFTDPASAATGRLRVVALEPGAPHTLYANTPIYARAPGSITPYIAESRVQRSTDGGMTWTRIDSGLPIITHDLVAGGGGRLFAYTSDGFWFSADAGTAWRRVEAVPGGAASVWSRADRPATIVLLSDAGLYRSDDAGAAFVRLGDNFDRDLRFILFDTRTADDMYAVGRLGQVYASGDGGRGWIQVAGVVPDLAAGFYSASMSPWSAGTLYAGTPYGVLKMVARAGTASAQEFFHPLFGHYFVTADAAEAANLLVGELPPWRPTGRSFDVWDAATAAGSATCRFFSASFAPRSSHFYTPYAEECAQLRAGDTWVYEGIAFRLLMPQGPAGARACPGGSQPLYRVYNATRGGAPNHRYTTSAALLDAMVGAGWVMEGEALTRVFACVPEQR